MDFKKLKEDMINAKIKVQGMTVDIPDSRPEGWDTMARNEFEYTKTINLVCDILEEYDKRNKQK